MINQKRMLDEFFELVKIKCSSRQEREVADVLTAKLAALGFTVKEDNTGEKIGGNCGNLIAFLEGTVKDAPVLTFSSHMDCVEPCAGVKPQLKDGRITSDGTTILGSDDKAGACAVLEAVRVIKEKDLAHGGIQAVFTVCEEAGLDGSKNIDRSLLQGDFCYVLDSGGAPGEIITKAPGQNQIDVTIHGKTAHAGLEPEKGINAIVVAGKALSQMTLGRIDEETTANVGIITGGRATNIVPDEVKLACEARSRNMDKLTKQTKHMCDTFENIAAINGASVEIKVSKSYDSYVLADDMPAVTLAVKAAKSLGIEPVLAGTGGGSDANFYNSYGIPAALLGVGMKNAHTKDEYILEEDLYNSGEFILAMIKQAATMKK